MTKAQARQMIRAHERAASRNPLKRDQQELAARLLRKAHGIPEPVSFGNRDHPMRGEVQRAEQDRIDSYERGNLK